MWTYGDLSSLRSEGNHVEICSWMLFLVSGTHSTTSQSIPNMPSVKEMVSARGSLHHSLFFCGFIYLFPRVHDTRVRIYQRMNNRPNNANADGGGGGHRGGGRIVINGAAIPNISTSLSYHRLQILRNVTRY